jgi:hypothetical protein
MSEIRVDPKVEKRAAVLESCIVDSIKELQAMNCSVVATDHQMVIAAPLCEGEYDVSVLLPTYSAEGRK